MIQKIGDEYGVVLPEDVLKRLGWQKGQELELHADETGIELRTYRSKNNLR